MKILKEKIKQSGVSLGDPAPVAWEDGFRTALEWVKHFPGLSQADWMRIKKELEEGDSTA